MGIFATPATISPDTRSPHPKRYCHSSQYWRKLCSATPAPALRNKPKKKNSMNAVDFTLYRMANCFSVPISKQTKTKQKKNEKKRNRTSKNAPSICAAKVTRRSSMYAP